jgi:hypothetical protein
MRRAVLAGGSGGALYVGTWKNNRARTVALVIDLVPTVDRWSIRKAPDAWLFDAPEGGPLRESKRKRSVGRCAVTVAPARRVPVTICLTRRRERAAVSKTLSKSVGPCSPMSRRRLRPAMARPRVAS